MLGSFWGERSGRERSRRAGRRDAVRRGHRPALEGLEARIVLATDTWTGLGVDTNWMTPGNWSGNAAPVAGDSLIFPAGVPSASQTNFNNFPAGTVFNSITIQAANYDLTGNSLDLSSGITASYTSGSSSDAMDMTVTAVVAPISVSAGGELDLLGVLSGTAGLNVTGGGTLDLGGDNTYTGPTTIGSATRLVVDGTIAGVQDNGGLLSGNGTVGAVSSVGGTIFAGQPATSTSPQPAPGTLTDLGSLSLDSGSTFAAVLNGTTPGNGVTGSSQLVVSSGFVSLGGSALSAVLGSSYTPTLGDQVTIIKNDTGTAVNGQFAGLPEGGAVTVGSSLFRISYAGGTSGQDVVLTKVSSTTSTTLLPLSYTSSGQINLSAQVSGGLGTPTGTIEFFNGSPTGGGILLASQPVTAVNTSTGLATATVSGLGNTSSAPVLYAVYIPTPTSSTYAGSTSAPISFTTTTTLTSSSPLSAIGQPVTFTATVAPVSAGAGTPTGSVAFSVDGTTVATVPLNPSTGQATYTTSTLGIGSHTIVATFTAVAPFQNSTSSQLTQAVGSAGTQTTLTLVPIRNRRGKVARFELVAQVLSAAPIGTPTGTVTFFINGRARYQIVPLTGDTATLVMAPQRLVNQYVYARYNGTQAYIGSASPSAYISRRSLVRLESGANSGGLRLAARQDRAGHSHEAV